MKNQKREKVPYDKCPRGAHRFSPTSDPWMEKCYFCPAIKKKTSIKVKPVKK